MFPSGSGALAGFEKKYGDTTNVKVGEALGFIGDVRSERAAHDAVPSGAKLAVELGLDERRHVPEDLVFLGGHHRHANGLLLHVLGDVRRLDHHFLGVRR